uniref:Coiled-coil domain-containing protein 24-like n=1 Tax=Lepisosteus oculatus TaxID=7918 RepID=W5LXT9_LEPOC
MLKQEIRLLLLNIQEKASEQGRDGNKALLRYSPDVVSYILGTSTSSHELQGPRSARSHDGRQQLPSRPQSANSSEEVRSFSRLSSTPSYLDDIEAIKDKLNIIHIDEVVAHLQ